MDRDGPTGKIFLVGFMGAGKTTLGRLLAERLGWPFADIDRLIEDSEGSSIVKIFAEKGEPWFRDLERRALAGLVAEPRRSVVALGGGTFCTPENQALMRGHGVTVWLDQPIDQIWRRRGVLAGARPLLLGEAEVRALYDRRVMFYRQADLRLPVPPDAMAPTLEELLRLLREHGSIL